MIMYPNKLPHRVNANRPKSYQMEWKTIVKSRAFKDFAFIFLLLGVLTLLFDITNLDIALQRIFYSPEKGWFMRYIPFWDLMYRFGIFPGYLFALAGLVMISVSYWNEKYAGFRKAAFMLVYTLMLGPGLIINLGLKDHWGRPRPSEITQFGGKEEYVCTCVKGHSVNGKSFPCGHCSMGFFIAVPYLIFRNRRKGVAYAFLATGVVYGLLMGVSRMIAGGHFASDVIWSGGIVWIVALTGVYLFRIDEPYVPKELDEKLRKRRARLATLFLGILLPVITAGIMVATPYISQKHLLVSHADLVRSHSSVIEANVLDAMVEVNDDTCFRADYKVNAFGFPNSKIRGRYTEGDTGRYQIQVMGWYTEIRNHISMHFPMQEARQYILNVDKGRIDCTLPDSLACSLAFRVKNGDIHLRLDPSRFVLVGDSSKVVNQSGKAMRCTTQESAQPGLHIIRFELNEGSLYLEKR